MASIITKMKLQNIENTKKKRKKRKNKTDTIKLTRKRANKQLNSNPKEALAIKRRKCKGPFLGRTQVHIVQTKHHGNKYMYMYKQKEKERNKFDEM